MSTTIKPSFGAFDDLGELLESFASCIEVTKTLARVGAKQGTPDEFSPAFYEFSHALFVAIADRLDGENRDLLCRAIQTVLALRDSTIKREKVPVDDLS